MESITIEAISSTMNEENLAFRPHSLVDDEGMIAWWWNLSTGAISCSAGTAESLFGVPHDHFGPTFEAYLELVHPDDRACVQAVVARTLAGADTYAMSHRIVWPDRSIHWIDLRGNLTRDESGHPLTLTSILVTNEDRIHAESKVAHLRRVEAVASVVRRQLLRVKTDAEVFDLACSIAVEHGRFRFAWIGIGVDDARIRPLARAGYEDGYLGDGTIVPGLTSKADGPMARAFRLGRAEVVNDIATDESFAPWREPALRRGYRTCGAFPLRRRGEVFGVLVIYASEANRFDDDHIELFLGLSDDIAFKLDAIDAEEKRLRAEEAMRNSEERYRALVEQAAEALFVVSAEGIILEINAATREMTGYSREELVGCEVNILFDPHDTRSPALLGHAPGTRLAAERRFHRKDGTVIEGEIAAIVLADGRIQGFARDVTSRNVLQQKLILADRLTSLGRLAAGVAHEINNPLTYVALSLERIERVSAKAPSAEALAEIRTAIGYARDGAERVRSVVRSLGAFSREDEGAVGSVDLHRVLDGAVRLSENKLRHRGNIVKAYTAQRNVRGNELRLGQVFVNLLVNAADALKEDTPERNEVVLRTFDEGERVVVTVTDNGVGIPAEIIGRIFDPFFTTKDVGEGTGLGLSISHGIVSRFGGQVNVESKVGMGSTFRISLIAESPLVQKVVEVDKRPTGTRLKLLIVDDEPGVARTLAAVFDHHAVTVVDSGRRALTLLQSTAFDVVLCDLMMPDLSGIELHTELVRMKSGLDRRMIFMTGGTFTLRSREFVSQIFNTVLEKPFTQEQAESAIAAVLAREGRADSTTAREPNELGGQELSR